MRPTTPEGLSEAVRAAATVRILGSGSKQAFGLGVDGEAEIDMLGYSGIVSHEAADQVVVVRAGTPFAELQEELARSRLCVPTPSVDQHGPLCAGFPGTVGGLVSMNLPHGLFAQCGGPRDWVLGMTVVRGDGTLARSGSKVVKSVAGYDVHKLFIGARGTLGVVAEVTFRTYPIRALPPIEFHTVRPYAAGSPLWIQRVLPSDFASAVSGAGESLIAADPASATLWACVAPGDSLTRLPEDWVLRSGCGPANLPRPRDDARKLMCATRACLDPAGKFNPGGMGVP